MGKSSKPTIGYWYRVAYHHGLTIGPIDAFLEMRGGSKTAWQGEITASGTASINAPNLWGGEKDQGGIVGNLAVMFGEDTQVPNPYLVSVFGNQTVAWRGFTTVAFEGGRYGAMNPYPQPASYKIRRILQGWDGAGCWYPERAKIPGAGTVANAQTYTDFVTGFDTNAATKFQLIGGAIANTTVNASNTDYYRTPLPGFTVTGIRADFVITADGRGDCLGVTLQTAGGTYLFGFMPRAEDVYDSVRRPMVNYWQDPATVNVCNFALSIGQPYTFEAQFDTGGGTFTFWLRDGSGTLLGTGTAPTPGGTPAYLAFGRTSNAYPPDISVAKYTRVEVTGYTLSGYMNPAHVLYESLTNGDMGREPVANVNDASFRAAADTLYAEGFGICPKWDPASESVDDFQQRICKLIGGSLSRSLEDGQWYLDLARGDYVLADLPILTDDDILDFKEQPSTFDNAINSVSVRYFDPEKKETIVTPPVRALGLVAAFGTIHQTYDYPEIPTAELATRVALRELLATTTPTRAFDQATTRRTYAWRPNQYFRLQAPKRGIADMVCLVGDKQSGTLKSGAIKLKAAQDIYSLPSTSFVQVEPGVDPTPPQTPNAITLERAFEAPYIEVAATLSRSELDALPAAAGYAMAVAVAPATELDFTMMVAPSGGSYEEAGHGEWCATATVNEAAGLADTSFTLAAGVRLDQVTVGMAVLWDDEVGRVAAIDATAGTITLGRGCADTVPVAHAAGSRLWFYEVGFAFDATEYTDGETVDVKLLSNTGSQQLPLASATPLALTFAQRQSRPYPPGKLRIAGGAAPTTATGTFTVTWAHRDRVQQADQLVDTEAASVGPETTVRYALRLLNADTSALLVEKLDIAGATADVTLAAAGNVRLELYAISDRGQSWQMHQRTFAYSAPGAGNTITATTYAPDRTIIDGGVVT